MVWGVTMMLFFFVRFTSARVPGLPDLQRQWSNPVSDFEAIATLGVLVALLTLLFREQQQVARERAILAGELQAAQQVQQLLAPSTLETLPGMRLAVAFHPVREVGGDFYNCSILPGKRQRIVIGDVSGKGAAAAMTAAVLLGAAQRREDESPSELLHHLNLVMANMRVTGFATCLCAEISADGALTLANAGHLAPYCGGQELSILNGLPLGITPEADYAETALQLVPGASLTFLSDGVVEARNAAGELFGFDRAAAISTQTAESIASTVLAFGQEDDITVVTLSLIAGAAS
jgi:serine phosphatase RsbU (regulator of sigma subunit)